MLWKKTLYFATSARQRMPSQEQENQEGLQVMKRQLIRSRLLKITVAFAMMISAIWLSGCRRQETETEQGAVYVAEDGDDETGTGAWKAPYATISHAAETAPGSLILVGKGEYEPLDLGPECSGSKDSPTVIRPAEGAKVVIHVEDETGIFLKNVHDISIEGLETVGGTYAVEYLSTPEAGKQPLSNISIRNCKVHGVRGQHGICVYARNDLAPVTDLTIEGCEVYDCECYWSESMVINGNIDGFLIERNKVHDNNNIGIDMIGFEGFACHQGETGDVNPYEVDYVRNGICRDNLVYNISTEGNEAYYEDGEYDLCAGGIYVDGGQNIEIYNNFIFNCDLGLEVATEHSPEENELFKVSGISVHDNVIADCTGFAGLVFGGYERDLGFTEDCIFDNNTLVDNPYQIVVQHSRNNRICANLVLGGEEGFFFEPACREEGQVNEISGNAAAEIENEESWTEEYGAVYSDRSETVDGFRPLIKDTGSAFVPDEEQMKIYKAQKSRNRWNQLLEKVESWFHRFLGESVEE